MKISEIENIWIAKFYLLLNQVITECTQKTKCRTVVDLGAGLGHLARHLAFKENLDVLCIEQDSILTEEAKYLYSIFTEFFVKNK